MGFSAEDLAGTRAEDTTRLAELPGSNYSTLCAPVSQFNTLTGLWPPPNITRVALPPPKIEHPMNENVKQFCPGSVLNSIPAPGELVSHGKGPRFPNAVWNRDWAEAQHQRDSAIARMAEIISQLETELGLLSGTRSLVVATANNKGGAGRTTFSACIAAVMGEATKRPVLVIGANPDMDSAAERLGFGISLELSEVLAHFDEGLTVSTLFRRMTPTSNSVYVISHGQSTLSGQEFERLLLYLENMFSLILIDTGPGVDTEMSRVCYRHADKIVFPALTIMPGGIDGVRLAQSQLVQEGFAQKVSDSLIVAMGSEYGAELEHISASTEIPRSHTMSVPYDSYLDPKVMERRTVCVIPSNEYMYQCDNGAAPKAVTPHTQAAYLEIALAIYRGITTQSAATAAQT
jgi:AAA domain